MSLLSIESSSLNQLKSRLKENNNQRTINSADIEAKRSGILIEMFEK